MRAVMVALIGAGMLVASAAPGRADAPRLAQATGAAPKAMPGKLAADAVKVRGTIDAIDKEKGTITLKGPQGRTVTLEVRDPAKLDAVKVGDPVVATYVEAVAFQVRKAGSAAPGATVKETQVGSKPGDPPAALVGREVTVTATITALDTKARTVTIKGPLGNSETFKIRDPKNAEGVKVGDLVEITYTQALAVALDKPAN